MSRAVGSNSLEDGPRALTFNLNLSKRSTSGNKSESICRACKLSFWSCRKFSQLEPVRSWLASGRTRLSSLASLEACILKTFQIPVFGYLANNVRMGRRNRCAFRDREESENEQDEASEDEDDQPKTRSKRLRKGKEADKGIAAQSLDLLPGSLSFLP